MARCKACGRYIEWVKTIRGNPMPVDPKVVTRFEVPIGTVLVTDGGDVVTVKAKTPDGLEGRISHFATCPNAEEFKRGEKK